MSYIKVVNGELTVAGLVATEEMLEEGYFLADIPESPFVKWDSVNNKVVVDEVAKEEHLNNLKQRKKNELVESFNSELSSVIDKYPQLERETWSSQEEQARLYISDNTSSVPALLALSNSRGIEISILANTIIRKADEFKLFSMSLIGKRQLLEDKVDLSTSEEEIELINWTEVTG